MSKNSKASLYDLASELQEVYSQLKGVASSSLNEKQDIGEVKKMNKKLDKLKSSLSVKLKGYLQNGKIENIYQAQAESHNNDRSEVADLINSLTESHISHQIVHLVNEEGDEVIRRGELFVLPICVSTKTLDKPFEASVVFEEVTKELVRSEYMDKTQLVSFFPELISNFELEFLDYKVWHDLHVELLGGPLAINFHERIIPYLNEDEQGEEEPEVVEESMELFFIVGTVMNDITLEEQDEELPVLFSPTQADKIESFMKLMSEHKFEHDIDFMAPFDLSSGLYIGCAKYYQQCVEEFIDSTCAEDAQANFFFAMSEEMNHEQYFVIGSLEDDSTLKEYILVKRQPYLDEELFIDSVQDAFVEKKVDQALFVEEFISLNAIERSQDVSQYFYNFSGVKVIGTAMQMMNEERPKYLH
jgi:hypothetical protein